MKPFIYNFRSIENNLIERENKSTQKSTFILEYNQDSIESHQLEVTLTNLIIHKSWIINFFLSIMIIAPLASLAYATFKIGLNVKFDSTVIVPFLIITLIIFIIIWISIAIPSSIKNLKKDHVINLRGKGNWKIIDENKWDKFYKLLNIPKEEDKQF